MVEVIGTVAFGLGFFVLGTSAPPEESRLAFAARLCLSLLAGAVVTGLLLSAGAFLGPTPPVGSEPHM